MQSAQAVQVSNQSQLKTEEEYLIHILGEETFNKLVSVTCNVVKETELDQLPNTLEDFFEFIPKYIKENKL